MFLLAALLVVTVGIVISGSMSHAEETAPKGCSASNVDYYYDAATGEMDLRRMAELTWLPVSARDSGTIIGCVPGRLADPSYDDNQALLAYGQGDPDVPLPIFNFQGELVGHSVVYKGSVSLADAIASGDVPDHLVADPPKVTDFDPEFTPHVG